MVAARARRGGRALRTGPSSPPPRWSAWPSGRARPGTDLALGIEARARALVSEGDAAEELHREAVERLGRSRFALDLARAHLALRRVAAPRAASQSMPASSCAPRTRCSPTWVPRRSRTAPAASCSPPARPSSARRTGHARRAHGAGEPGRPAGPRRAVEPGDRRAAVHQPAHGPVPPAQGVREARHHLAQSARPRVAWRPEARLAPRPACGPAEDWPAAGQPDCAGGGREDSARDPHSRHDSYCCNSRRSRPGQRLDHGPPGRGRSHHQAGRACLLPLRLGQ